MSEANLENHCPSASRDRVQKKNLTLASASPRRLDLLKQIHITPTSIAAADIDETPLNGEKPCDCALRLAQSKAAAVHQVDSFTLAADTIVACGVRMLPKTETVEETKTCLKLLSGRRHTIYGGIALITPDGKTVTRCVETVVQFKKLNAEDIQTYLETQEWKGIAGGYAIQGYASTFIKSIRGSYSNVVGLSLYDTMNLLKGNGFWIS